MAMSRHIGPSRAGSVSPRGELMGCSRPGKVPDHSTEAHGWWPKAEFNETQDTVALQLYLGETVVVLGGIRPAHTAPEAEARW